MQIMLIDDDMCRVQNHSHCRSLLNDVAIEMEETVLTLLTLY